MSLPGRHGPRVALAMILVLFAMGWGVRFVHLASVDQDRPYGKETQLAYFEGQKTPAQGRFGQRRMHVS